MKRIILIVLTLTLIIGIAIPVPAMAWTKWDLEGWRDAQSKWMDGLLWTYYEDEYVPYRLVVNKYDGLDTSIVIQHDYLDANGHFGVDGADNFYIGPKTGRTNAPATILPIYELGDGVFHVNGPSKVEVSNGYILEWELVVDNIAALQDLGNFAFYWEAHLAKTNSTDISFGGPVEYGASFWSGASLHAHTSVTGNQDVPIKTPPVVAEPSIDVEKLAGGGCCCESEPTYWYDADEPGIYVSSGGYVWYKFVVTNNGDVPLSEVTLSDDVIPGVSTPPGYEMLEPGESFEIIIGPLTIVAGEHTNTATATGKYGTYTCEDTDIVTYVAY